MDDSVEREAVGLLGIFSEEFTALVDHAFGTEYISNEETLALIRIASDKRPTTREIADDSGLGRRAISRLVVRLVDDGVVTLERSTVDARAMVVLLTPLGRDRVRVLRRRLAARLVDWGPTAQEMVQKLGGDAPPAPALADRGEKLGPLEILRRIALTGAGIVDHMRHHAPKGLPPVRQLSAIQQIHAHPGMRPSQLAPKLGLSRAGVAYVVDQLCTAGFAERRRGAVTGDARAVELELTPDGQRVADLIGAAMLANRRPLITLLNEIAEFGPASEAVTRRLA
ncbi:MarR family transcriptional regulator [Agromyces arachidis]|uniref:MarR family transcriptional regulator n=1 Tax=Agromyces arachidis TaxID=766966 RepID=UPI004056920D